MSPRSRRRAAVAPSPRRPRRNRLLVDVAIGRSAARTSGAACSAAATGLGVAVLHWTARALDPLGQISCQRAVFGALGAKRVAECFVPLVALIWEQHAAIERCQRNRNRKWPRIGNG